MLYTTDFFLTHQMTIVPVFLAAGDHGSYAFVPTLAYTSPFATLQSPEAHEMQVLVIIGIHHFDRMAEIG